MVSWGSRWVWELKRKDGVDGRWGNDAVWHTFVARWAWTRQWQEERRRVDESTSWVVSAENVRRRRSREGKKKLTSRWRRDGRKVGRRRPASLEYINY